jgi:hypothetical protein
MIHCSETPSELPIEATEQDVELSIFFLFSKFTICTKML